MWNNLQKWPTIMSQLSLNNHVTRFGKRCIYSHTMWSGNTGLTTVWWRTVHWSSVFVCFYILHLLSDSVVCQTSMSALIFNEKPPFCKSQNVWPCMYAAQMHGNTTYWHVFGITSDQHLYYVKILMCIVIAILMCIAYTSNFSTLKFHRLEICTVSDFMMQKLNVWTLYMYMSFQIIMASLKKVVGN